jgi:hypothetical protein
VGDGTGDCRDLSGLEGRYGQRHHFVGLARSTASSHYRIPESFKAFCSMVSFTAAKTSRIFDVSVACVKLYCVSSMIERCMS